MSNESREPTETAPTSSAYRMLAVAGAPDERFTLATLTLPPHDPGLPRHTHPANAEGCYILEGMLAVTQGDHTITVMPGAAVRIPAGIAHSIWNPTATTTRVLLIYTPGVAASVDTVVERVPGEARPYDDTS